MIVYAGVIYPLLGLYFGHRVSEIPPFGLTPCPLVIFTLGLLLLTSAKVPRVLLVIPTLWSLIGGSAALLLGIPKDWALLVAGPAATVWIWVRDRPEFSYQRA
jgi:hypothetical protein